MRRIAIGTTLLFVLLAGCGERIVPTSVPGAEIISPPLSAVRATPSPTAPTLGAKLISVLWVSERGSLPEGIQPPVGSVAGLISYILPEEAHGDAPAGEIVLIADGETVAPMVVERDPNGVVSGWFAVPSDAVAVEWARAGAPPTVLGAVPTSGALSTRTSGTLLGEMEYVNAASSLIDLRASALLDVEGFLLPGDGRVTGIAVFRHLSRGVSRVVSVEMPLEGAREAAAEMLGLAPGDVVEEGEGRWSLGRGGDAFIGIEGYDDSASGGLDGLTPILAPKAGRCVLLIAVMASSWNTEVGGDEDPRFAGPGGDVWIARLTLSADFAPAGSYEPTPGEMLMTLELGGSAAAVEAALAHSAEARLFSADAQYVPVAAAGGCLYYAVPLVDGPTRLYMFGIEMELPLP